MKKKCIIYGAGSYGQVYVAYLRDYYEVLGFLDDDDELKGATVDSVPVLGNGDYLKSNPAKDIALFVPIGNNAIRVKILDNARSLGYKTPSFVHKDTRIHDSVTIGEAVYILLSTSIMPFTTIGDNTMISMGVNIAHHVTIENGCFFSQGCNIGASIHLKKQAYCGIASTIMTGVKKIGEKTIIGAGAVVINDLPSHCTAVGIPAKPIKFHS